MNEKKSPSRATVDPTHSQYPSLHTQAQAFILEQQICFLLRLNSSARWRHQRRTIYVVVGIKASSMGREQGRVWKKQGKKVGYNDKYPSREREEEVVLFGYLLPSLSWVYVYAHKSLCSSSLDFRSYMSKSFFLWQ